MPSEPHGDGPPAHGSDRERLERVLRHLEGFTRVIAHDLKAPLANVSSFAQLLPGVADMGEQGALMAERIAVNSRRAALIVDAVIDHARRIGREVDPQPVDLAAVMVDLADTFADRIAEVHADLEWGDLPPILGDPDSLRTALRHLVDNALRYKTPDAVVHVRVDATIESGDVVISVVDDGPGIPSSSAETVFELGTRLVEVAGPIEGSGVGLATVRVIAENHGGTAMLGEPPSSGGTTVVLRLPQAVASAGS